MTRLVEVDLALEELLRVASVLRGHAEDGSAQRHDVNWKVDCAPTGRLKKRRSISIRAAHNTKYA